MQDKDSVGDTYQFGGHTIDFNAPRKQLTKERATHSAQQKRSNVAEAAV